MRTPVTPGEWAAGRLPGAVPHQRRQDRHRARHRREVAAQIRADARTVNVQFDWDEPSERSVRFEIDQQKAREVGVTSSDVSSFLALTLSGYTVTQYRERDKLINVELRAPRGTRRPGPHGHAGHAHAQRPRAAGQPGQLRYGLEYAVIWERDRQPTITVQADVVAGAQGIDVTHALDKQLDALRQELPVGYRIQVGGSVEESAKGQNSINAQMPIMLVVVLDAADGAAAELLARVMMVVLTAPLGLIGVVATLLLFGQPFGFVAMLGVIAMFGIIMRNSVILVDQIEQDIGAGHQRIDAIVGATVRRFRPITLTAAAPCWP